MTPWTVARQAPLSIEFSREEYWSRLPFPSPGDFPDPGTEPRSPALQAILYQLIQQGSPRILKWEAYPFSIGSSQPRNQTGASCIAGGFFASWATREALAPLLFPFFSQVDMSLSRRVYLCLLWFSLLWNVYLGFFPNVYLTHLCATGPSHHPL